MIPNPISLLFTDLYELTMAAAYFEKGLYKEPATFSLYIRGYPPGRNYYIAAGIEDALTEIETLCFYDDDLDYLQSLKLFSNRFLSYLKSLRFTGEIRVIPEGTVFFADEPILEITAPVVEAQILETFLINAINLPVLVATKAARCFHEAKHRQLIDFSLRRTQGVDAGIKAARSTYLAGFSGTSNVMAGRLYGIPVSGTMAHSYVLAFDNEISAFRAYADIFPDNAVFLIDTYDTLVGAENAISVAKEMNAKGHQLKGVRLDSGDMIALSKRIRQILNQAGLNDLKIFASSGFDEYKIKDVISKGAKIDAFGVGTKLGISADAPYQDIVYKMVQYQNHPVRKISEGKQTLAGEKQVFRHFDEKGHIKEDILGMRHETFKNTISLLRIGMKEGQRLRPVETLENIRSRFVENFKHLPDQYKILDSNARFPVITSPALNALQEDI